MTKEREALSVEDTLKLALEAMKNAKGKIYSDVVAYKAIEVAIIAAKEALAQPEQDTCKGCNGIGVVGNILDTDICPFCNGSGIEAQPEQEPFAWVNPDDLCADTAFRWCKIDEFTKPVYTTPPQRTWVGLTKGEVYDLYDSDYVVFHQRIEAKLKAKNFAEEKNP